MSPFNKIVNSKTNKLCNSLGQATIEYILLFAVMSVIAVTMAKSITTTMEKSVGGLAQAMTNYLTIGVCPRLCYFGGYGNGVK